MRSSLFTLSIWFIGVSAFGQCLPTFLSPCTSGDLINDVTFNTISNLGTGCSNPGINNYSDYTAISTALSQGSTYQIFVAPGSSWGEYFAVWIDFNQNNTFDPNEFYDIGYATGGTTISASITIPIGISPGTTKMRVLCRYGTLPLTSVNACTSNINYGECEDYTVVIAPLAPNDASTTSLDSPSDDCGLGLETIIATFSNVGTNSISDIEVCYRVNGGAWNCDVLSGLSFASLTDYQHSFSNLADLSTSGDYYIDVSVSLVGDGMPTNDTIFGQYVISKPIVSSFPYIESFESGHGGWQAQNGSTGTWELAEPAGSTIIGAASGQHSWITNATGNYASFENSSVLSPCFDFTNLPSGSSIAMNVWWNCENDFDGANFQYSLDDGATWSLLGQFGDPYNWYNDGTVNSSPGGSSQGWSGWDINQNGSSGWVTASHSLDDATFIGQTNVLFRVNFASDGSSQNDGFAFDDVIISVPPVVDLGPDFAGCTEYELDIGAVGDYQWYTQDPNTSATTPYSDSSVVVFINPSLNSNTTYYGILVLTDSLGLSTADTVSLTFTIPPDNTLLDLNNCHDDIATYSVGTNPNYSYNWNNGSTTSSAQYTGGGLVEVIVTDTISGCADTASAMIYQMPPVDVNVIDTSFCFGDSVVLGVTNNIFDSYLWNTTDTTSSIAVATSGTYTLSAMDSIGCLSEDSSIVLVNALPIPVISGLTDTLCIYSDLIATGDAGFSSYSWSTGGMNQSEPISGNTLGLGAHVVTLSVQDTNGCFGSSGYTVFVDGCAGIEEFSITFTIYPNPSNGLFYYEIEGELSGAEANVTDVLGKVVWSEKLTLLQGEIDLSMFKSGTYFLTITHGEKSKVIRLIKE
ncbi:MAG: GEVED domain-containing protein [Crocinitomicaceae bacterium]